MMVAKLGATGKTTILIAKPTISNLRKWMASSTKLCAVLITTFTSVTPIMVLTGVVGATLVQALHLENLPLML